VDAKETYLVVTVTLLFAAGLGLLVATVRQKIRLRKEWD